MTTVHIRVPATSANLGPGYDALGLALSLYDDIDASLADGGGVEVVVTGEGAGELDTGEGHLVVKAMRAAFDRMGTPQPDGIRLRCHNRIPHARGLGSSSAAICAGILAARALSRNGDLTDDEVFALADEMEGHPDNVAPCLAGGLTIAWTQHSGRTAYGETGSRCGHPACSDRSGDAAGHRDRPGAAAEGCAPQGRLLQCRQGRVADRRADPAARAGVAARSHGGPSPSGLPRACHARRARIW